MHNGEEQCTQHTILNSATNTLIGHSRSEYASFNKCAELFLHGNS